MRCKERGGQGMVSSIVRSPALVFCEVCSNAAKHEGPSAPCSWTNSNCFFASTNYDTVGVRRYGIELPSAPIACYSSLS